MYCKKCGAEIHENCKYCPVCGTAIENPAISEKSKHQTFLKNKYIIVAILIIVMILIALLFRGIIFSVQNKTDNLESDDIVKGSVVYADHSVAEDVAYAYVSNILLAGTSSDYESFVSATTIDWTALFVKLNENGNNYGTPQEIFRNFIFDNIIFESVYNGYDYFKIETVSITDYPYAELRKNIRMFGKLFRPLSLSAVNYISFSDIRTLNSVVLSVEFYDESDNIIATEQLDITVVAESSEYYSTRYYSVLYDNFFMEKFITTLYPEDASTVLYE